MSRSPARGLVTILAALATVFGGLFIAPTVQAAPAPYKVVNLKVDPLTTQGYTAAFVLSAQLVVTCPAGASVPISVAINGLRLDFDGIYGSGSLVTNGYGLGFVESAGVVYTSTGPMLQCTGRRQVLTGHADSGTSPNVLRRFRPTRHVQFVVTLGPITSTQVVNVR
jgi:hypothetical protein